MIDVVAKTIRLRGKQLDQARELKQLAESMKQTRAELQQEFEARWKAAVTVIGGRMEDIWKCLGTAVGLEDVRCWEVITEFLDDHEVAFLMLNERADIAQTMMENSIGLNDKH